MLQPNPQPSVSQPPAERPPMLIFSPLAWLKLQFFLHAGDTEVGGLGVSGEDLLYVQDFVVPVQKTSPATVEFDDAAVADYFDAQADQGKTPGQCGRIWLHTHPGSSPLPSRTDERTFERVFGRCDWSVMFIIARSGQSYARLRLNAGPGAVLDLPVGVDWAAWPQLVADHGPQLENLLEGWMDEYGQNIRPEIFPGHSSSAASRLGSPWPGDLAWDEPWWEMDLLAQMEEERRVMA